MSSNYYYPTVPRPFHDDPSSEAHRIARRVHYGNVFLTPPRGLSDEQISAALVERKRRELRAA